jgi:hypothetical protein
MTNEEVLDYFKKGIGEPLNVYQEGKLYANIQIIGSSPFKLWNPEVIDAVIEGDPKNPNFKRFLTWGQHAKLLNEVLEEVLGK